MKMRERYIERELPRTGSFLDAGQIVNNVIMFILFAVPAACIARADYLFFHGMAEFLRIFLMFGVFIMALNTYHIARNDYLMFLGICYGFVAGFEFLHTIATGKMDLLPINPANLQLKGINVAGYMESLSLLLAPVFLHKKIKPGVVFSFYLIVSAMAMADIYFGKSWPFFFASGTVSPYLYKESNLLIFLLLTLAIPLLIKNNKQANPRLLHSMFAFLSLTAASRFFLLFDDSLTAISGHFLKLVSAYWLFRIVVNTTLKEPYRDLLRESNQTKNKLQQYDQQIKHKITEYRREERELQRLSYLDGLTGIPNRRFFDEYFNREWYRALRSTTQLSLILCDIDYFKKYNDSYGHLKGDNCLKNVASVLNNSIKRHRDLVARYGGEEFVVVLPGTDIDGAAVVAETLRAGVEALMISSACLDTCSYVTISLGVATLTPNPDLLPEKLIAMADRALYRAKEDGRNRVQITTSLI